MYKSTNGIGPDEHEMHACTAKACHYLAWDWSKPEYICVYEM
jgi:hypothetical protein